MIPENVNREDFEKHTHAMTKMALMMREGLQDIGRAVRNERQTPRNLLILQHRQCLEKGDLQIEQCHMSWIHQRTNVNLPSMIPSDVLSARKGTFNGDISQTIPRCVLTIDDNMTIYNRHIITNPKATLSNNIPAKM